MNRQTRRTPSVVRALAFLLLLGGGLFWSARATSAQGTRIPTAAVVRCEPTAPAGIIGLSDAVVDIYIEGIADLYGVDIRVASFNTTIAQVVDQLPATGVQIQPLNTFLQPDIVVVNTANNTLGTVRYAASQMNPTLPVSGSGAVARITFEGLQAGSFPLVWGAIELSTINGIPIPYTTEGCTVTFTAPTVRCNPSSASVVFGEGDIVVDMYVENVIGLYGVDLTLDGFDTTIAQVVDQLPAAGVQIEPLYTWLQPAFIVENTADNTLGTIRYAATQFNPSPAVNGAGAVARVTFTGLKAGTFNMPWGTVELTDIDGNLIPVTVEPCTITFLSPLSVSVVTFDASQQTDSILLSWETGSELGNRGFNLMRGTLAEAPDKQLNGGLIASQSPGSPGGFLYQWTDSDTLVVGTTYYYWLEGVDLNDAVTLHGPIAVTFRAPTAVMLSGIATTTGIALTAAIALGTLLLVLALTFWHLRGRHGDQGNT